MTELQSFEPSRLALARRRRGFSRSELAQKCALKPRTITAYEHGERVPSSEAWDAMATALRFPVAFFSGPTPERLLYDGVSFRALSKTAAKRREQAIGAGEMALCLSRRQRPPPVQ